MYRKTSRRKPTLRQQKWAQEYLRNGGNGTQAALKAYPDQKEVTAPTTGSRNKYNPIVQIYMQELLDQAGLTDGELATHLSLIIESSTKKKKLAKVTPADGLRGIEMAYKLKDRFPAQRKQIETRTISLNLEGEELLSTLEEKTKQLQEFHRLLNEGGAHTRKTKEEEVRDS